MEGCTNIFYVAMVAAVVFLSANSAPTQSTLGSMAATRQKRSADDLLGRVYLGLDILQKVSFYEMMKTSMNISNDTAINTTYSTMQTSELVKALEITCDLHRASSELIPAIQNASNGEASGLVSVLGKLGDASTNDSCAWLKEEVWSATDIPAAFECNSLPDICTMRTSNDEYKDAISKIKNLDSEVTTRAMAIQKLYISGFNDTVQQKIGDVFRILSI